MRFILLIAAVVGLAWVLFAPAHVSDEPMRIRDLPTLGIDVYPEHGTQTGMDHVCFRKKRCLVAYVAPWCPACKSSMPLINRTAAYLNERDDAGMVVVMGTLGREWTGHKRMAAAISAPLYVDHDGDLWDSAKTDVEATPGWIAYDGAGTIIGSLAGGYRQSSQRYIDEILKRVGLANLASASKS